VHKTTYKIPNVITHLKQLKFSTLLFKYTFQHTFIHCGYDYSHLMKDVILKPHFIFISYKQILRWGRWSLNTVS